MKRAIVSVLFPASVFLYGYCNIGYKTNPHTPPTKTIGKINTSSYFAEQSKYCRQLSALLNGKRGVDKSLIKPNLITGYLDNGMRDLAKEYFTRFSSSLKNNSDTQKKHKFAVKTYINERLKPLDTPYTETDLISYYSQTPANLMISKNTFNPKHIITWYGCGKYLYSKLSKLEKELKDNNERASSAYKIGIKLQILGKYYKLLTGKNLDISKNKHNTGKLQFSSYKYDDNDILPSFDKILPKEITRLKKKAEYIKDIKNNPYELLAAILYKTDKLLKKIKAIDKKQSENRYELMVTAAKIKLQAMGVDIDKLPETPISVEYTNNARMAKLNIANSKKDKYGLNSSLHNLLKGEQVTAFYVGASGLPYIVTKDAKIYGITPDPDNKRKLRLTARYNSNKFTAYNFKGRSKEAYVGNGVFSRNFTAYPYDKKVLTDIIDRSGSEWSPLIKAWQHTAKGISATGTYVMSNIPEVMWDTIASVLYGINAAVAPLGSDAQRAYLYSSSGHMNAALNRVGVKVGEAYEHPEIKMLSDFTRSLFFITEGNVAGLVRGLSKASRAAGYRTNNIAAIIKQKGEGLSQNIKWACSATKNNLSVNWRHWMSVYKKGGLKEVLSKPIKGWQSIKNKAVNRLPALRTGGSVNLCSEVKYILGIKGNIASNVKPELLKKFVQLAMVTQLDDLSDKDWDANSNAKYPKPYVPSPVEVRKNDPLGLVPSHVRYNQKKYNILKPKKPLYREFKPNKLFPVVDLTLMERDGQKYVALTEELLAALKDPSKEFTTFPIIKVPKNRMTEKRLYWLLSQGEMAYPPVNIKGLVPDKVLFEIESKPNEQEWVTPKLSGSEKEIEQLKQEIAELSVTVNQYIKETIPKQSNMYEHLESIWKKFKSFSAGFRAASKHVNIIDAAKNGEKLFKKWLGAKGKTIDELLRKNLSQLADRIKKVTPSLKNEELVDFKEDISPISELKKYPIFQKVTDPVTGMLTPKQFAEFLGNLAEIKECKKHLDLYLNLPPAEFAKFKIPPKEKFMELVKQWEQVSAPFLETYSSYILPLPKPKRVMLDIEGKLYEAIIEENYPYTARVRAGNDMFWHKKILHYMREHLYKLGSHTSASIKKIKDFAFKSATRKNYPDPHIYRSIDEAVRANFKNDIN